jgi:hypothetical protein
MPATKRGHDDFGLQGRMKPQPFLVSRTALDANGKGVAPPRFGFLMI